MSNRLAKDAMGLIIGVFCPVRGEVGAFDRGLAIGVGNTDCHAVLCERREVRRLSLMHVRDKSEGGRTIEQKLVRSELV